MHKIPKRLASLILAMSMLCSIVPSAFAVDTSDGLNSPSSTVIDTVDGDAGTTPSNDGPDDGQTATDTTNGANENSANSASEIYQISDDVTYYVNNTTGSDKKNDGSEESPFLTIGKAIQAAQAADAVSLTINLLTDVDVSQALVFDDADMNITITSAENYAINFTGTNSIGASNGFMDISGGANVTFDGITLQGPTGGYDARLVHVENAQVALTNCDLIDGQLNDVSGDVGGAALYVGAGATATVTGCSFEDNETLSYGGAVFVDDGGFAVIDSSEFTGNSASHGGAIVAATQTEEGNFGLELSDVTIQNNSATQVGGGMYVYAGADVEVAGSLTVDNNTVGGNEVNVFLADDATLDIGTSTSSGSNIGITVENPEAYTPVSFPVNHYTIQETKSGDEAGWHYDDGSWDIRYMNYNGNPGLYLYWFTIGMTFEDVTTLTNIEGKDINGEIADFLNDNMASVTRQDTVLTVADTVAKNTPEDDDLVIKFALDAKNYRIPTEDVVNITSGGQKVAFTYEPNFADGTATITIDDKVIDTLSDTIKFVISGEKYSTLTVAMEGPLYTMSTSITELGEKVITVSGGAISGGATSYKLTQDNVPVEDVMIQLHEEGTANVFTATTNAEGVATFNGLNDNKAYSPVLIYSKDYRVIKRDVMNLTFSTLEGQEMDDTYDADENATGHVTYNASAKTASITGIENDARVTFRIAQAEDIIVFLGNEGEATTAPATINPETKVLSADAENYGELASASLVGYTFVGWFDAAVDGNQIVSTTPYVSGSSPKTLYAHWTPNTNTAYKIQHWVEYAEGGANVGYDAGVTQTKIDNGKTYYLYETTPYADGTSDAVKDISSLDLDSMSDSVVTWWTREGFTARYQQDCKVQANGSSEFSIYYDRNTYELTFDPSGAGSVTSDSVCEPQHVKFGALVGELPTPALKGYAFGGWYDGSQLVTATTVYSKTVDTELTAHWNAKTDTNWAIKLVVQDIEQDKETGIFSAGNTYTEYKTVYQNNNGDLLTAKLEGTSDTEVEFEISSIDALTLKGFNYVGYANSYDKHAANKTADTDSAIVVVKPTDESTEVNGEYNQNFDGGIVYLYYDRKTAHVDPNPELPGGDTDGGDIIWGGDFTGQLPPDPGKDGHDFDGWVDEDGNKIDENTPADDYVDEDNTIVIDPTWTARDYRLTYVPGDGASFRATDNSGGTKNPSVPGGYTDSKDVTYGEAMGDMPTAYKPGYTFVGWFVDDTQITEETIVSVDNVVIHNDDFSYEDTRPLYAHFTPHVYTLVLKAGASDVTGEEATVDPKTVDVTFDSAITGLPVPELKGYTFVSWVLKEGQNVTAIKNGDIWKSVYTDGAKIPVYATYIPNTYKYTFDLNDDIGSTKGTLIDTSIDYVEETFDSVYEGIFKVEAVRPGYTFKGWSLDPNGTPLTSEQLVALAQDATVYAIWEAKEYDVKFVMKGSTMPEDFMESHPNAVYSVDNDTVTIKVKFDSTLGTLPVPTKTDAKYHGWLVDAENWSEIHNEIITVLPQYTDYMDVPGITLTAVLEPWITFDPQGNPFTDDQSTDPRKELQSDIDELPAVSKPDYTFDGWVTDEDPDKILTLDDILGFEDPVVVKPHFSANITFNANGGKISGQDVKVIALSDLTTLPSASKSGYSLTGWYTAPEGGTQITLDKLIANGVPTTVYAHWTVNTPSGGGGGGGGGAVETPSYEITVEEDEGADVTPNGTVKVDKGDDQTFEIGAEDGYIVTDVIVDGESIGVVDKYTFKDVKEDHVLKIKVAKLLTGDHIAYISGYPDGSVQAEANITRAEASAIFYRLLSAEARARYEATTANFSDSNSHWASKEIATLAKAGILNGYNDGSFRPDDFITRAEFAAIAARFDKLSAGTMHFSDVPSTHWAYSVISSAAEKGWVNGYSDGTFRPENSITRAEVVKITNAVLDRVCDEEYVSKNISNLNTFNDLYKTYWAYYEIMEAANAHDYEAVNGTETWTGLTK